MEGFSESVSDYKRSNHLIFDFHHKKEATYCETISAYTRSTDLIFKTLKKYSCCDTIHLKESCGNGWQKWIEMEWIRAKAVSGNVYW
jgi:hypothetical protein